MFNFYEIHPYELELIHNHRAIKYGEHMHNEFEAIYIFDGQQNIMINETEHTLHKGDCAVIFPNTHHSYTRLYDVPKNNTSADYAMIFMPPDALYNMFPDVRGLHPENCVLRNENLNENVPLAFNKIFEESNINTQIGWAYIIFSHTVPILAESCTSADVNLDLVTRLLSYIALNFRKSLTLDMLSDELGINKYYISRIFSQKIKVSFRTYIGMLRSNYAASMLKTTDAAMEHIGRESGFESLRSFYRVFRDTYGVSPSEYREMTRKYKL